MVTAVIDVIHCRGKDNHCLHAPIGGVRRCNKASVKVNTRQEAKKEGHPARRRLRTTWHRVPPLLVRRTRCTDTSALSACFPSQIACRFLAASSIEAGLSVPRAAFSKQVPPRSPTAFSPCVVVTLEAMGEVETFPTYTPM